MKRKILLSIFAGIVLLFVGCILGFALHLIDMNAFCGPIMAGVQKGVDVTPLYKTNVNLADVQRISDIIDLTNFSSVEFANDSTINAYSFDNSINIFINYWKDINEADKDFKLDCENVAYSKNSTEYGGEFRNEYCISRVRQLRTGTDELCLPRGEYESFVVFQKENLVIAITEVSKSPSDLNKNKVILVIAEALTKGR